MNSFIHIIPIYLMSITSYWYYIPGIKVNKVEFLPSKNLNKANQQSQYTDKSATKWLTTENYEVT